MPSLEQLVERLAVHRVEFVIVGGLAATIYGCSLVTKDVDVCTDFSVDNLRRIDSALKELHPYHRMTPQRLPFMIEEGFERGLQNIYLHTDLGEVDFLGEVTGVGSYAEVLAHSVSVKMPYGEYRLLSIDKLILAKDVMGREKDRIVARQLRAIREAVLPDTNCN